MGAPLTVGYGEGENYLGSDALALAPLTQRIAYLDEGDWVVVERDQVQIFDRDNQPVEREIVTSGASSATDRQGQSRATSCARKSSSSRSSSRRRCKAMSARSKARSRCPTSSFDLAGIKRVTIVACGTSYYAGMVAKYWFEQFARVPVDIDVASRVPLPPAGARAGRAGAVHLPIGRDRRHARRAAPCARRGAGDRGGRQRADQLDGARGRPAAADPRRARNRRRLDQGVHLPAGGARRARRQPRARQGQADRERGARDRRASAGSARGAQRRARP